ncbi:MAG: hypothetical protein P1U32_02690 [Legionellaceae bacterium]|nr:hypothetical protein [Legionellaceae bacterium]
MKGFIKQFAIVTLFSSLFCSQVGATYNNNPASIGFVEQRISEAAYKAGPGITINNNRVISQTPTYFIGQNTQGGVIIYLDETRQHGLAIALLDVTSAAFSFLVAGSTTDYVDATGQSNGIGGGALNTPAIQGALAGYNASQGQSGGATAYAGWYATLHRALSDGSPCPEDDSSVPSKVCFGNFYLPSTNELQIIADNNGVSNFDIINAALSAAGGTPLSSSTTYWTSTTDRRAFGQSAFAIIDISTGAAASRDFGNSYAVRPVRQF